jgi:HK97 family phage prohead protease
MIRVERRALAGELRGDVAGRKLTGYAAVFDQDTRIGSFLERIRPGAFRASLDASNDVLALADHDPARLLARTRSGTLRLAEDAKGLQFTLDVPDTQLGHDILVLATRGDLGGCSIGFRVTADDWPAADRRELRQVELVEMSIVAAHPAYEGTSVTARAKGSRPTWRLSPAARRRLVEAL